MDAKVSWHSGLQFTAVADSGHEITLDGDPSVGGTNLGARPLELMLMSLAGCTGMDVISILKKKRQDVTAFEVKTHAERAQNHPKVFTAVTVEYIVTGHNIDPKAVERAIELSEQAYCPAQAMLVQAVPISHTYRIINV
ncbi:MAG: OsmC family protein [Ardenticatenaceae bacterium]|nr:OsmC family protein [Anaerolineales bacterium]MCB8985690.1 OsmC family protein [Ardenticatenaceae bacterium]